MKKDQLQKKFLYCVIVAGKTAEFAKEKLQEWEWGSYVKEGELPFQAIRRLNQNNQLRQSFEESKTGNYTKLTRACQEIIKSDINLKTCDPEELEQIYGVGPKTSRFFVMWTRDDEEYGILDTHILKWLQEQGYDVPDDTPQNKDRYKNIQNIFLNEAKNRKMEPRELDFMIWNNRASGGFSIEDKIN